MENIQKFLKIDPSNLEGECLAQAPAYWEGLEEYAAAKSKLSAAKDSLDFIKAEVTTALLNSGAKMTVAAMEAARDTDKKVVDAKKKVREYEELVSKLFNVVQAMDVKKSELDNIVKLQLSGVYSSTEYVAAKDAETTRKGNNIRKRLNKKAEE